MNDKTNKEDSLERVRNGQSWEDFCDQLKAAGKNLICGENSPENILDQAEGWRYLARLTRSALDNYLEAADTQAPVFTRAVHETIKMGMDNPDNVYLSAPVNGNFTYRITGQRGSVHYLGFGSQAGGYGKTGQLETTGYLEAKDIAIEDDGSFEIIASSEEQSGNWLPMSPDTRLLQVRQTRLDHKAEVLASVEIDRIDGPNQPRHFQPERADLALKGAARFVSGTSALFHSWTLDFKKHTNELPRFDPEKAHRAGGDPHIAYYHSYFNIADDEALVIKLHPPECEFWNFQLANYWLESLDYRYFPVHLNKKTAHYDVDGSVTIVVSKVNPGLENWMDTCGRNEGTMCVRWIRAEEHPQPETKLVKLNELTNGSN